jgi:hypothetical protein
MALYWFLFLAVGAFLSIGLQVLRDPFQPISSHFSLFLKNNSCFVAVILCMTPIYLWDMVKLSNRFAGPIMRLQRSMRSLAEGAPVGKLAFRPGDFWLDLADDFNLLVEQKSESAPSGTTEDVAKPAEEPALALSGHDN